MRMDTPATPFEALQFATQVAGSQSALARTCSVGQPAVWKWLQSSKRLPAEYVLTVEAATGVSRHLLRPDIYPLAPGARWPDLPQPAEPEPVRAPRRRRQAQAAVAA